MRTILLTNDDGVQSPFARPFGEEIAKLVGCDELRSVFPTEEQSWIGQAVTRFRPLYATPAPFPAGTGFLVNGTPADCVGLGLDQLYSNRADVVISGINIGINASLPFYLSSGTVGAARQALCFGVRAIAVSAFIPSDIFIAFREFDEQAIASHESHWKRISLHAAALVSRLLHEPMWTDVDLFSINMPWEIEENTEVVFTELERATYRSLYAPAGAGRFEHSFRGFDRSNYETNVLPKDLATLESGKTSVTPIRYRLQPSEEQLISMKKEFASSKA